MIKKISKSIREYKKATILTSLFVCLEVVLEVLITFYTSKLIDNGIEKGDMNMIIKIGLVLAFMAILSLIFGILSGVFCAKATSGFSKNLRQDLFYKIQNFSFNNIDKFKSSGLITRLTTDVEHISMAFQMIIRVAVRAPLTIIFSLIMIVRINLKISLIFLIVMPILLIGLTLIIKKAHPMFRTVFDEYDNLNNVVSENLSGIRLVKSFTAEEKEIKKFEKVSNKIYRIFKKAQNLIALNGPLMQGSVYLTMLLLAWFGAKMVVSSTLTTGELMVLFTYVMQILGSLMMVSMIFVVIVISKESCERVCEILDEEIDLKNNEKCIKELKDGSITFNDVYFSYVSKKEKSCLKEINFQISSAECVGIIGSTGSGKSTLVQLIPRLYDVTSGEILIGETNVKDYDLFTLREKVAMVLQKNTLFSGTINENLKWGDENATKEEIEKACELSCSKEFIETFPLKYDTYVEQEGTNLSGGQKQRLCIARALLKKPKILILDDSTSAVDTKTDNSIRKYIKKVIPNTTTIIIAQRINSIMDCDKIIVMDDGKVNEIGTHEELLKNNKIYKEVYSSQMEGGINE